MHLDDVQLNGLSTITPTTGEPVSVRDAKDHLNITDDRFDGRLKAMIRAATEYCQRVLRQQFMPASHRITLDNFPAWRLELPLPPLRSITTIGYTATSGSSATLSSTAYTVITSDDVPGFVEPAFGESWPTPRDVPNAVTVTFATGYVTRVKIPDTIKQAILLLVGHWYESRETVAVGVTTKEIELTTKALLSVNDHGEYS